jgi:hypothetical protein
VRAANREQLENFIDHDFFCTEPTFRALPAGNTRSRANGTAFPEKKLCSGRCHARRISD